MGLPYKSDGDMLVGNFKSNPFMPRIIIFTKIWLNFILTPKSFLLLVQVDLYHKSTTDSITTKCELPETYFYTRRVSYSVPYVEYPTLE